MLRPQTLRTLAVLALVTPLAAQGFARIPDKQHLPTSLDLTQSIKFIDIEGDGDQDLIASSALGAARAWTNDGHGVFTEGRLLPASTAQLSRMTVMDFDGDGDLDIFGQASPETSTIAGNAVYLQNNGGLFSDVTNGLLCPCSTRLGRTAFGDVDNDGDSDVVITDLFSRSRLYLNDGLGRFFEAAAGRIPDDSAGLYRAPALLDADGDGNLDLLILTRFGSALLYVNDGTGSFAQVTGQTPRLPSVSTPLGAIPVDIDADGDTDVIGTLFSTSTPIAVLVNSGGTFTEESATRIPTGRGGYLVEVADMDQSGSPDIVAASRNGLEILLNDGSGSFGASAANVIDLAIEQGELEAITTGDADGDGDLDIAVALGARGVVQDVLFLNDGNGGFTNANARRSPATPFNVFTNVSADNRALVLGDVDADGDQDLIVGQLATAASGLLDQLFLNDGTGRFTNASATNMPNVSVPSYSMQLFDVDGDSDLDLMTGAVGQVTLALNSGTGQFTNVTTTNMPTLSGIASSIAVGDVDGDGDLDAAISRGAIVGLPRFSAEQNVLLLNDGSGVFTDVTATNLPVSVDSTRDVELADLDGDGDLDMVFANAAGNQLLLNDGSGVFTDASSRMPTDNDDTTSVALGDVNGDSAIDILFTNLGGFDKLYVNNGSGFFSDASASLLPQANGDTYAAEFVDFDFDGQLDLVLGRSGDSSADIVALRNPGGGLFSFPFGPSSPVFGQGLLTSALAFDDLDGDGDIDFVANGTPSPRLYFGLDQPQLQAPLVARTGQP